MLSITTDFQFFLLQQQKLQPIKTQSFIFTVQNNQHRFRNSVKSNIYFIFTDIKQMGNMCQGAQGEELDMKAFHRRNTYGGNLPGKGESYELIKRVLDGENKFEGKFDGLAENIRLSRPEVFEDEYFLNPDPEVNMLEGLSELYDFGHLHIQDLYHLTETRIDSFQQKDLELAYLASVFYAICKDVELKHQIFVTKKTNQYKAYLIRLFCNGTPTLVAVNQKVPLFKNNPKYLNTQRANQIWPFLLEKAWCKQIGSYPKARGLSPEDAFEEITGIPAYSYSLDEINKANLGILLEKWLNQNYWIVLTAPLEHAYIRNRQVFYIEYKQDNMYSLRSPYTNYEFQNHQPNSFESIKLGSAQIKRIFQFLTVGYLIKNHVAESFKFKSLKREEKIHKLQIKEDCKINLRFIQFYSQYMGKKEAEQYGYSPVFLELYDEKYMLVNNCEGCPNSINGSRSAHISPSVIVELKAGCYYLRTEVDWLFDSIVNQGNIVIYAPRNSFTFEEYPGNENELRDKMYEKTLKSLEGRVINNDEQRITIKSIEKQNGYLIGFQNEDDLKNRIQVNFSDSKNLRFKNKSVSSNTLNLNIEGNGQQIIEIVPEDPAKPFEISPFKITKL